MVRLKDNGGNSSLLIPRNFNSTMVRLKVSEDKNLFVDVEIFQFHYGSIKSIKFSNSHSPTIDFNSTMVRLKVQHTHSGQTKTRISIPLWFD